MDFSLSKEQMDIKKAAGEFARGEFKPEIAQECELNHRFPRELYQKAGELGFIGLDYPEELVGGGMGVLENVLVVEEFCKVDLGIGMAIHLACLPAKIVRISGTPEERSKYLSPLVKGRWVSAVSFTEPDHGSDLTRMDTTLEEKEDGFILRGTKIFTTNAIAGPGDTLEIKGNTVWVNSQQIAEPYANFNGAMSFTNQQNANFGPKALPTGAYFVMGDNRNESIDSRRIGRIEEERIGGKVTKVFWSWNFDEGGIRWDRTAMSLH